MFRFTIRDLLWLTVVVAVVALLWIDRLSIERDRSSLSAERESLNEEFAAERVKLKKREDSVLNVMVLDRKS